MKVFFRTAVIIGAVSFTVLFILVRYQPIQISNNFISGALIFPSIRVNVNDSTTTSRTTVSTKLHPMSFVNTTTTTTQRTQITIPKPAKRPPCYPGKVPNQKFEFYTDKQSPDVTVVTAYFNLGTFRKGGGSFGTNLYMRWAGVYRYLRNPFVFYTDSVDIAKKFEKMRAGFQTITKVILLKRESLWSFSLVDRIRKIYSTPGYPKHYPNTVVPEYTCVQHAKYDVVEETIKNMYFNTTYFTWIDLGYFRNIVGRNKSFVITRPPNYNGSQIAMSSVYAMNTHASVRNIFRGNQVAIGGGMFFGTKHTLPTFISDYRRGVQRYLNMSLSSTDQQVIYAMLTLKEALVLKQRVPIQQYVADAEGDCWFFLGYACYRELAQ